MKKYSVCWTEVYTGFETVEANSPEEAMDIVKNMIDKDELDTKNGSHEITADFADEED